jgi:murein DD-endopeptidase MepM/ murein hydrolase activator NlpD
MQKCGFFRALLFVAIFSFLFCGKQATQPQLTIGVKGGTLEIPNTASITFPEGTFNGEQSVSAVVTPITEDSTDEFAIASAFFRVSKRLEYEIMVNSGALPNSDSVEVVVNIPQTFLDSIPDGDRIELFVKVWEDGGMERLDNYHLFESEYDSATKTIKAFLPSYTFTNMRRTDGKYELVFSLASTPGGTNQSYTAKRCETGDCMGAFISCPLSGGCDNVSRYFYIDKRPHPISGQVGSHHGVDFPVPAGTIVLAASDGIIERKTYQYESQTGTGYGNYVILRHKNGSATLYAHLKELESIPAVGTEVKRGEKIALSGNSGGSTGPHLHFEYVPNGEIIRSKMRIDPLPCLEEGVDGSITVWDNGTLADDAFYAYLDGIYLGATEIGGLQSFAINNIIPGQHSLKIVCMIAPDNVGTSEIILNDGITFLSGATSKDGTLYEGESVTLTIIVPDVSSKVRSGKLRLNRVIGNNETIRPFKK